MKLSELIENAQEALAEHADLEVLTEDIILQELVNIKLKYIASSILYIDRIVFNNPAYIEVKYERR